MTIHHTLAFTFGILGNIISFLVYLAPVPTFLRICRNKSTEGFHSVPYLVALFSSMLWLYYAILKKDALLLITINSFGFSIEIIYTFLFIAYASKASRVSTVKLFVSMNVVLFCFIVAVTTFVATHSVRIQVLGWICVTVSVTVFASPLSIVAQVIRTKSVEFMPFTLSFFLTTSAIVWFAFGLFSEDICIAVPNVLGFVLGVVQMLLHVVYRNSSRVIEQRKMEEKLKKIVVLSPLGVCETYPVHQKHDQGVEKNPKQEEQKGNVANGVESPDDPLAGDHAV